MNLSQKRFLKGDARFRGADGIIREAKVYSYETQSKLYDIILIDGMKLVRVNCGQLSNMISDWKPIHYRIEQHFKL